MNVEHGGFFVVDFAEIVAHALDAQPFALRVDHLPVGEVVQRRTPQHGFFAARVHRHVAAHAGRVGRSRIDGEHQTRLMRGFFHPPRYHARAAMDNRMFAVQARQFDKFHAAMLVQLFRIDDCAHRIQRHGAAGITRAAAARDNRQIQFNQRAHQGRDFRFRVGIDDDKRIFDAPVGRIGNMRYPRQPVKHNIVRLGDFAQTL